MGKNYPKSNLFLDDSGQVLPALGKFDLFPLVTSRNKTVASNQTRRRLFGNGGALASTGAW